MAYIRKDRLTSIPINGGELILSSGYDVIHLFNPLGKAMLKYWNQDSGGMSNVIMDMDNAVRLGHIADLSVVQRPFILASECEMIRNYEAENLNESDFDL